MSDCVGMVRMFAHGNEELQPFVRAFAGDLAKSQFQRLDWDRKEGESYFDQLLRPTIIGMMCYSEDPGVVEHAQKLFNDATKPSDLPGDLRAIVMSVAAKYDGPSTFDRLIDWYKTASAEERVHIIAGLSGLRDEALMARALELWTTKTVKLQDLFYWFVHFIRSKHGRVLTWRWMQDNWDWIKQNFGSDMHYSDFPRYAAGGFSTQAELDDYKRFFEPKMDEAALARDIKQGLESIESRILWRDRDFDAVVDYLKNRSASQPKR
jgi:aminopeptidase N